MATLDALGCTANAKPPGRATPHYVLRAFRSSFQAVEGDGLSDDGQAFVRFNSDRGARKRVSIRLLAPLWRLSVACETVCTRRRGCLVGKTVRCVLVQLSCMLLATPAACMKWPRLQSQQQQDPPSVICMFSQIKGCPCSPCHDARCLMLPAKLGQLRQRRKATHPLPDSTCNCSALAPCRPAAPQTSP